MKKVVPSSPGLAEAGGYCLDQVLPRREPQYLDAAVLSDEVRRFDAACNAAAAELDAIVSSVGQQVGEEKAAIFRAHRALLRDPNLITKVKAAILSRQVDAGTALHDVVEEYTELLSNFFFQAEDGIRDLTVTGVRTCALPI